MYFWYSTGVTAIVYSEKQLSTVATIRGDSSSEFRGIKLLMDFSCFHGKAPRASRWPGAFEAKFGDGCERYIPNSHRGGMRESEREKSSLQVLSFSFVRFSFFFLFLARERWSEAWVSKFLSAFNIPPSCFRFKLRALLEIPACFPSIFQGLGCEM